MSSRQEKKKACSAGRKSTNRPYPNRPGEGRPRPARPTPREESPIRVILPDEPPRLTPEVAQVLLRIILKARDQLNAPDHPHGGSQ
jgi:hypothetical protein